MTATTTELLPNYLDVTKLAVTGFLSRYREPTLTAYTLDLRTFLGWCHSHDLDMLRVTRAELELYVRYLESRGYAPATVARRFGTIATFFKYAVIDELIPSNPAVAVTHPRWHGKARNAPCCIHSSSRRCCQPPGRPARSTMPWFAFSGCSVFASVRLATRTSPTSGTSPATSCSTSSAKEPSRPTSRCRFRSYARSGKRPTADRQGRSCVPDLDEGWTAPPPAAPLPASRPPPG